MTRQIKIIARFENEVLVIDGSPHDEVQPNVWLSEQDLAELEQGQKRPATPDEKPKSGE